MKELVEFNTFGLMKVSCQQIVTTATAMTPDRVSINRSLTIDLEKPISGIQADEFGSVMFAALLEPGQKSRTVLHEINRVESGIPMANLPAVQDALEKILEMMKKASKLS